MGEFGSVDDHDERAFLESISPYAQVKRGVKYPEPFINIDENARTVALENTYFQGQLM